MDAKEQFIREVEDFLEVTGVRASTFGRAILKDASFVSRLREKRGTDATVSLRTVQKVRNWMKDNAHLKRQAAE